MLSRDSSDTNRQAHARTCRRAGIGLAIDRLHSKVAGSALDIKTRQCHAKTMMIPDTALQVDLPGAVEHTHVQVLKGPRAA